MSLINEALKRAQSEQAQRAAGVRNVHIPPAPIPQAPVPRKASPVVAAVVAAMVVSIGLGTIWLWKAHRGPAEASAAAPLTAPSPEPLPSVRALADVEELPQATLIKNEDVRDAKSAKAGSKAPPDLVAAARERAGAGAAGRAGGSQAKGGRSHSAQAETYILSGIMQGAAGDAALINGKLLNVGQHVGKAQVVQITSNAVVLEVEGQTITLRM